MQGKEPSGLPGGKYTFVDEETVRQEEYQVLDAVIKSMGHHCPQVPSMNVWDEK